VAGEREAEQRKGDAAEAPHPDVAAIEEDGVGVVNHHEDGRRELDEVEGRAGEAVGEGFGHAGDPARGRSL
jgi:hypothetical protein